MRIRIKTVEELEKLPDCATVLSYEEFKVFQKLTTYSGWPCRHAGKPAFPFGTYWFTPGSVLAWDSEEIPLPAILLDDGL